MGESIGASCILLRAVKEYHVAKGAVIELVIVPRNGIQGAMDNPSFATTPITTSLF